MLNRVILGDVTVIIVPVHMDLVEIAVQIHLTLFWPTGKKKLIELLT
jgi:hypothetical protein